MVTNRFLQSGDIDLLAVSLAADEHHKTTEAEFFYEPGTVCAVYEDDNGPVLFARGKALVTEDVRLLQLDLQFVSNLDFKRNIRTMLEGFLSLEAAAKANGFIGIVFESEFPPLRRFCVKRLGFTVGANNYLIKVI